MHLNHYLARAGVCSRRKAAELIKSGEVIVNGTIQKDPAYLVQKNDSVKYKNRLIKIQPKVYLLLNKPAGFVTTTADEMGRKTVLDLIPKKLHKGLFPVGRLDKETTGLILLTNDGDWAQKLAHPSHVVKKVYSVTLDKPLTNPHASAIRKGVQLRYNRAKVDGLTFPDLKNRQIVRVALHSGKKRIIRRIFEHFDYKVRKLDRINFAGLTKRGLLSGQFRPLTEAEIEKLRK